MKAYLIDTEAKEARVVEISDGDHLTEYYKLLKCYLIDIARRKVGGKYYDIIVDDEGLFAEKPTVSAIDSNGDPALVGNLLFCNHDGQGGETSLTDQDIARLQEFTTIIDVVDKKGKKDTAIVVKNVDY